MVGYTYLSQMGLLSRIQIFKSGGHIPTFKMGNKYQYHSSWSIKDSKSAKVGRLIGKKEKKKSLKIIVVTNVKETGGFPISM